MHRMDPIMISIMASEMPTFILGYIAILAVPGPNLLAPGGLAAVRGFQAAVPFALGAASGATALAAVTGATVAIAERASWLFAVRGAGSLLLIVVALRILQSNTRCDTSRRRSDAPLIELGTGFVTAIGNPVTMAYFTAEYANVQLPSSGSVNVAMLTAVPLTSGVFYLGISALLASP